MEVIIVGFCDDAQAQSYLGEVCAINADYLRAIAPHHKIDLHRFTNASTHPAYNTTAYLESFPYTSPWNFTFYGFTMPVSIGIFASARVQNIHHDSMSSLILQNAYPLQWSVWVALICCYALLRLFGGLGVRVNFWREALPSLLLLIYGSFLKATISLPAKETPSFSTVNELVELVKGKQLRFAFDQSKSLATFFVRSHKGLNATMAINKPLYSSETGESICDLAMKNTELVVVDFMERFGRSCDMSCFVSKTLVTSELLRSLPREALFGGYHWLTVVVRDKSPVPLAQLQYRQMLYDFLRTAYKRSERRYSRPAYLCQPVISPKVALEKTSLHIYAATIVAIILLVFCAVVFVIEKAILHGKLAMTVLSYF